MPGSLNTAAAALRISSIVANATDIRTAIENITVTADACCADDGSSDEFRSFVAQQIANATTVDDLRQRNCGLRYQLLGLQDEIATRKRVDRAQGILARRHHISEADAYAMLRAQSRRSGRTLREAAEAVITIHALTRGDHQPVRRTA